MLTATIFVIALFASVGVGVYALWAGSLTAFTATATGVVSGVVGTTIAMYTNMYEIIVAGLNMANWGYVAFVAGLGFITIIMVYNGIKHGVLVD